MDSMALVRNRKLARILSANSSLPVITNSLLPYYPIGETRHQAGNSQCKKSIASSSSPRSYEKAVSALHSLESNANIIRQSEGLRRDPALHVSQVAGYLNRLGITLEELDRLPVIHVAGTKGKGSTGAFSESILRQHGYKTGFFNSPHLIEDRERIRLNGRPMEKALFSKYFWQVLDKLHQTKDEHEGDMPFYFSFLAVMSLYVFLHERVDVAVLEVGIGGEYDSTNVVRTPTACGITALDLDHVSLLGDTLEKIAWQKAGIFKKGVPSFTVEQFDASAMNVLIQRSEEKKCPLYQVMALSPEEMDSDDEGFELGISGERQLHNASLAVQMCRVFLGKVPEIELKQAADTGHGLSIPRVHTTNLSAKEKAGLRNCYWPGRSQTIVRENATYYLDGAHTPDSVKHCSWWYKRTTDYELEKSGILERDRVVRALVFNVTGKRDVVNLLEKLKDCGFDIVAFCPNTTFANGNEPIPEETLFNQEKWESHFPGMSVSEHFASVESALKWVTAAGRRDGKRVQVLVTGSLYLVGSALQILKPCLYDSASF